MPFSELKYAKVSVLLFQTRFFGKALLFIFFQIPGKKILCPPHFRTQKKFFPRKKLNFLDLELLNWFSANVCECARHTRLFSSLVQRLPFMGWTVLVA
jgi:hypothetical protein